MSAFVETDNGSLVPVANVSRIVKRNRKMPNGHTFNEAYILTKDDHEHAAADPADDIALLDRTMIPAGPGWSVLSYYAAERDGEPELVMKVDVICSRTVYVSHAGDRFGDDVRLTS
jgi:hypothetical protein